MPIGRKRLSKVIKPIFITMDSSGSNNQLYLIVLSTGHKKSDRKLYILELKKSLKVDQRLYFYQKRNQTEIDFILGIANRLIPIEVKASSFSRIPPSCFISFIDEHSPQKAFVLNADVMKVEEYSGCKVYFLPLFFAGGICKMVGVKVS